MRKSTPRPCLYCPISYFTHQAKHWLNKETKKAGGKVCQAQVKLGFFELQNDLCLPSSYSRISPGANRGPCFPVCAQVTFCYAPHWHQLKLFGECVCWGELFENFWKTFSPLQAKKYSRGGWGPPKCLFSSNLFLSFNPKRDSEQISKLSIVAFDYSSFILFRHFQE